MCVFSKIKITTSTPGLQTANFHYCKLQITIFIHYSYIFVLFTSFLQISIFKKESFNFKRWKFAEMKKKIQECMNYEHSL